MIWRPRRWIQTPENRIVPRLTSRVARRALGASHWVQVRHPCRPRAQAIFLGLAFAASKRVGHPIMRSQAALRNVIPPFAPWQVIASLRIERVVDAIV